MRLIDADKLEEKLDEERKWLVEQDMKGAEHILVHYLLRHLWEAPTIPNEVVRCKDCKYRQPALSTREGATGCQLIKGTFYMDFYCAVAERRDDDTD